MVKKDLLLRECVFNAAKERCRLGNKDLLIIGSLPFIAWTFRMLYSNTEFWMFNVAKWAVAGLFCTAVLGVAWYVFSSESYTQKLVEEEFEWRMKNILGGEK